MNRTIYYRNLAVFMLFVAVLFAAPYVFADASAPTNICLDSASIQMHNRSDLGNVNGTLTQGTIIQLPTKVAELIELDDRNEIDLYKTRRVWHGLARTDKRLYPPLVDGKRLYPVKVLHSDSRGIQSSGKDAIGYISLAQLFRAGSFHTCRFNPTTRSENEPPVKTPQAEAAPTMRPRPRPLLEPSKEATGTDYFFEGEGFNEVTTNEPAPDVVAPETAAPLTSLRPRMRPERVPTPTPKPEYEAPTRVMNPHRNPRCENIRSRVASALGERVESSRVNCYLDLFHKETGCRHNLSQAQGNAGNPHAGYGLCSLEASAAIRRQNRRGPECATIRTVEQQTRCCASIMAKFSRAGSYFGPVRIGVVRKCD